MADYYNEWEKYPAEWLRNLMLVDEIPDGFVDETDIRKVNPDDLKEYAQCHFFAGIGGWPLALKLAGWPKDREVWTGSCPCQPFSAAGKQKGFADERHLWPAWFDLIKKHRPATVFGEQVASATAWLGLVRSDLEALGYAVGCMPVQAASAGADHLRDRFWFVADNGSRRRAGSRGGKEEQQGRTEIERASDNNMADDDDAGSQKRRVLPECSDQRLAGKNGLADSPGAGLFSGAYARVHSEQESPRPRNEQPERFDYEWVLGADGKARRVGTGIRLLAHGVPQRVAKLRALGNAIDPRPSVAFITAFLQAEQEGFS